MAVFSVVILIVLFTSKLQVDGSYFPQFYPLQNILENALMTEETLYTMRQAFFPVVGSLAQEVQQVRIRICVEITVDQTLNSTSNASCRARDLKAVKTTYYNNVSSLCWRFLWTDSALLSLITIDQLVAFDMLSVVIYGTAIGNSYYFRYMDASLQLICSGMPNDSDIKTSLMLLLSWSKSYARNHGVPPQWEDTDKGYIQELYDNRFVAKSTYTKNDAHTIRLGMIVSFILLNVLVLIGVIAYGEKYYMKVYWITSESARMAAVSWAFMIALMLLNSLYLFTTLYGFTYLNDSHPRVWACLISNAHWCASMKSTKLYSDEVASLLVKLTVVPFTIGVELIIAVRLTSHTLLPFPYSMATRSQCCSFRIIGKRVVQTIPIWNVMVFIRIFFGAALLPFGMLMVIVPVTTMSAIGTLFLILVAFTVFITFFILQWCNPFSLKQFCSLFFCFHIFTAAVILSLSLITLSLYYYVISLGVQPWSVKGSILSLLPSFLVTPLLWFAKKYFFKKDRAGNRREGTSTTVHTAHSESIEEAEEWGDEQE